jgi:hypothetical protein
MKSWQEIKNTHSIYCGIWLLSAIVILLILFWPIVVGIVNNKSGNFAMYILFGMMIVF